MFCFSSLFLYKCQRETGESKGEGDTQTYLRRFSTTPINDAFLKFMSP